MNKSNIIHKKSQKQSQMSNNTKKIYSKSDKEKIWNAFNESEKEMQNIELPFKQNISGMDTMKCALDLTSINRKCNNTTMKSKIVSKDLNASNVPKERDICEYCSHLVAISEEGYYTCTNSKCGIIYNDVLNYSPEWRFYGTDDQQHSDPNRCGIPTDPLFEESSNGCKLLCTPKMSFEMRKIYRYIQWQTMPYKEKSQYDDFQYITSMSQNNGISKKITDDAFIYYKKIFDSNVSFRGENRDSIIAASIYISCRINKYPRTAKEIAQIFTLDVSAATKGCKKALNIINSLEQNCTNEDKTFYCMSKPSLFIERFCNKLNIPTDLTMLCEFICLKVEHFNILSENTPQAIASGVIYFISVIFNLGITKKDIKQIIDISEVTINKCFKKINLNQKEFLPPSLLTRAYKINI